MLNFPVTSVILSGIWSSSNEIQRQRHGSSGRTWTRTPSSARYLNHVGPKELAKHCMEDSTNPDFMKRCSRRHHVADKNFGCGILPPRA